MLVEPDISPLAKRLAEENNVNWRGLMGSGAGGKIVERDVLEYLAKVMAGEEDVNPTSEPLPEGMEAWPEDDVRSFYGGAVPATDAVADTSEDNLFVDMPDLGELDTGVMADSSLATFDTNLNKLEQSQYDDSANLGEDIFLIEDEVTATSTSQSANLDIPDQLETSEFSAELDSFQEAFPTDSMTNPMVSSTAAHPTDSEATTFDEISEFDDEDSEIFTAMRGGAEDIFNTDNDVEDLGALFVDDLEEEGVALEAQAETFVATKSVVAFEAPAEPTFDIPSYASEVLPEEDVLEALTAEDATDAPSFAADLAFESMSEPTVDETVEVEFASAQTEVELLPESEFSEPEFSEPEFSEPAHDYQPTFTVAPAVAGAVLGAGVAASLSAPHMSASDTSSYEAPVVTPSVASGISSTLPLVSYGVLLRRHVDLGALMQAQHAVAEELGDEEPVLVTSFLLRAAAKAQRKVPVVSGQVIGLAVIQGGAVSVVQVAEASSPSFRQMLSRNQQALSAHKTDSVDLVVADMSGFDIDEAVLNLGVPVLTLGRTMYDSSKGTHHSTLSLSGNVSVESGTKFLSAVAELLNAPVRLVV
jgi:hypothetical protein